MRSFFNPPVAPKGLKCNRFTLISSISSPMEEIEEALIHIFLIPAFFFQLMQKLFSFLMCFVAMLFYDL
jgi:hypothetical protein